MASATNESHAKVSGRRYILRNFRLVLNSLLTECCLQLHMELIFKDAGCFS